MRVLLAPDKFKGCCTARAAAEALARGFRKSWPEAEIRIAPVADGGEDFAEAIKEALGGEWVTKKVADPIGGFVSARYLWVEKDRLAVIEASEASGLARVPVSDRRPLTSSSYGTGELIRAAAEQGANTIIVGIGGTATTDGGIGIAKALGYSLGRSDGGDYIVGVAKLTELAAIRRPAVLRMPSVIAAVDVRNPLLGERGAARVYAPQKGATAAQVNELELGLVHLAKIVSRDLGTDFSAMDGAGAGGGISYGLLSFCAAELRSGFDLIADYLGLEELVRTVDLVITGEGRVDAQTLEGKAPAGVAQLARRLGKPVIAFAGEAHGHEPFDAVICINDSSVHPNERLDRAVELMERAAMRTANVLRQGNWRDLLRVADGESSGEKC